MTALRSLLAIGIVAAFCVSLAPAQDKDVEVIKVNYDALKQEIVKHRGKVVVVDFWQTTCGPCREAMPHYIELQKKHAADGLVVLTVSLDDPANAKKVKSANAFLTEIKSPLRNLILDEPLEMWFNKFEFKSLPFAYVFDRRGKWVRYRSYDYEKNPEKYETDIKGTIAQMLAEK